MNKGRNSLLSSFLLFCFSFALIPFESFHHHEWESEVCNESELHFAHHAVDCELADFSITKALEPKKPFLDGPYILVADLIQSAPQVVYFISQRRLRDRGPPN